MNGNPAPRSDAPPHSDDLAFHVGRIKLGKRSFISIYRATMVEALPRVERKTVNQRYHNVVRDRKRLQWVFVSQRETNDYNNVECVLPVSALEDLTGALTLYVDLY